jgi:hypothetical protein
MFLVVLAKGYLQGVGKVVLGWGLARRRCERAEIGL